MKINSTLLILAISIIGLSTSCFRRPSCDSSDEKKLGTIQYSATFNQFNIEKSNNTISFSSPTKELAFTRNTDIEKRPQRLNDYKVCESINIKPYSAYAYFEYENLESVFMRDFAILVITPEIEKIGDKRGESLYINFGKEGIGTIKARVPISNIDTTITYQPFGELFKFNPSINIGNQTFENIWSFRKENMGMYYSKSLGVVALEADGEFYFRN